MDEGIFNYIKDFFHNLGRLSLTETATIRNFLYDIGLRQRHVHHPYDLNK
jgi:hypothetical protein